MFGVEEVVHHPRPVRAFDARHEMIEYHEVRPHDDGPAQNDLGADTPGHIFTARHQLGLIALGQVVDVVVEPQIAGQHDHVAQREAFVAKGDVLYNGAVENFVLGIEGADLLAQLLQVEGALRNAVVSDGTFVFRENAADELQQRTLARTVVTGQTDAFAGGYFQTDAVQRRAGGIVELKGDILQLDGDAFLIGDLIEVGSSGAFQRQVGHEADLFQAGQDIVHRIHAQNEFFHGI